GRTHSVFTGLALFEARQQRLNSPDRVRPSEAAAMADAVDVVETRVTMRRLTESEIRAYVASGEPLDKAGAYGIQGLGALLVREIRGCYFNVVGLPLSRLAEMLVARGVRVLG
ncbi:MAG: Maf family protein, partial [Armatimonadota bacterium]